MTRTEKHEKFKKLAVKRVNDTMQKIHLIGNLSNRVNYYYTEDEISQIVEALKFEIELMEEKFKQDEKTTSEFNFR